MKKLLKIDWLNVTKWLARAVLLTWPLGLQAPLFRAELFTGAYNPFLSFSLYAFEILILLSLISFGCALISKKVKFSAAKLSEDLILLLFLLLIAVAVGTLMIAAEPALSFLYVLRLLEFLGLMLLLSSGLLEKDEIVKFALIGLLLQVLLALLQLITQGSLGLRFLGESVIGSEVEGVAKIDTQGGKFVRPYGTFVHANLLGGAMLLGIGLLSQLKSMSQGLKTTLFAILLFALIASFSRSAGLGLLIFGLFSLSLGKIKLNALYALLAVSVVIFGVVVFSLDGLLIERFLNLEALQIRGDLFGQAYELIRSNPLGIGFMNSTVALQALDAWQYQPIHNIFALSFVELGLVGGVFYLGLFAAAFKEAGKNPSLIALLVAMIVVGFFDHYFYTLPQGLMMLMIVFALIRLEKTGIASEEVAS